MTDSRNLISKYLSEETVQEKYLVCFSNTSVEWSVHELWCMFASISFFSFVRNIVPYLKKYAKNPVTGEVCTEIYSIQLNAY